jgi:pyruvate kinase
MTSPKITKRHPKTKIVCTLGPSTESEETIQALIESGMSIARLNFSHGNLEGHALAVERVRRASKDLGMPVGIMVDVPGPKYRTGPLDPGVVEVKHGDVVTLTSRDVVGTRELISVAPPGIHRDATVGRPILLDDGLLEFRVIDITDYDVRCDVIIGGRITERRGVTTPGKAPSQPFPDERAKEALTFAAEREIDFIALSTVTTDRDVEAARAILNEQNRNGSNGYIISKIERAEALENLDSIISVSDAIMVARGDMGVEVPLSRVPIIQKDLIRRCNTAGKPVITATQMLESMVRSQVPTRAEVTDVANAIFDGTDAIMLSGETSVGRYPVDAVKVMAQIALEAEEALPYGALIMEKWGSTESLKTDDAISYDAVRTAFQLEASLIVAFTESGGTAGRVSKYRPLPPILALTPGEETQRRLTIRWGVIPVIVDGLTTVEDFFALGERQAIEVMGMQPGSLIVLVAGVPIGVPGGTNLLRVMRIS